mmetsp:Transcript_18569/g.32515  ORF Transcript_18569/g.32515 Transcript_18569/m.32515 type:complete len:295 (-) Transcript_18569:199-1083(-)
MALLGNLDQAISDLTNIHVMSCRASPSLAHSGSPGGLLEPGLLCCQPQQRRLLLPLVKCAYQQRWNPHKACLQRMLPTVLLALPLRSWVRNIDTHARSRCWCWCSCSFLTEPANAGQLSDQRTPRRHDLTEKLHSGIPYPARDQRCQVLAPSRTRSSGLVSEDWTASYRKVGHFDKAMSCSSPYMPSHGHLHQFLPCGHPPVVDSSPRIQSRCWQARPCSTRKLHEGALGHHRWPEHKVRLHSCNPAASQALAALPAGTFDPLKAHHLQTIDIPHHVCATCRLHTGPCMGHKDQ